MGPNTEHQRLRCIDRKSRNVIADVPIEDVILKIIGTLTTSYSETSLMRIQCQFPHFSRQLSQTISFIVSEVRRLMQELVICLTRNDVLFKNSRSSSGI